jgi:hypothetical protein
MDPTTASYYRAVLFTDGLEPRRLPESLVQLHQWVQKRHLAMGLNGTISKAMALNVSLTWLSSTEEGRQFSCENLPLGDMFVGPDPDDDDQEFDWGKVKQETPVHVLLKDDTTVKGEFMECRGSWTDVRIDGEVRHFRTSKVQVVGA